MPISTVPNSVAITAQWRNTRTWTRVLISRKYCIAVIINYRPIVSGDAFTGDRKAKLWG